MVNDHQRLTLRCDRLLSMSVNELCVSAQVFCNPDFESSDFAWGLKLRHNSGDNVDQRGTHGTACSLIALCRFLHDTEVSPTAKTTRYAKYIEGGSRWLRKRFDGKVTDHHKTLKVAEVYEALLACQRFLGEHIQYPILPRFETAQCLSGWRYSTLASADDQPSLLASLYVLRAYALALQSRSQLSASEQDRVHAALVWIRSNLWNETGSGLGFSTEQWNALRGLFVVVASQLPAKFLPQSKAESDLVREFVTRYSLETATLTARTNFSYHYDNNGQSAGGQFCEVPSGLLSCRALVLFALREPADSYPTIAALQTLLLNIENSFDKIARDTHDVAELIHLLCDTKALLGSGSPSQSVEHVQPKKSNRRSLLIGGSLVVSSIAAAAWFVKWVTHNGKRGDGELISTAGVASKSRESHWLQTQSPPDIAAPTLVFIHGVDSNSDAFLNTTAGVFWPTLVKEDAASVGPFNIFIVEHSASLVAGNFDIAQAAIQVFTDLEVPSPFGVSRRAALDAEIIVFVCHSLGGVIVRKILIEQKSQFKGKKIGLLLYASPSSGSWLADASGNIPQPKGMAETAGQLTTDSEFLEELNRRFQSLMRNSPEERGFTLVGREFFESKFPGGYTVPDGKLVVPKRTKTFFEEFAVIPDADHSMIVKPNNIGHPSHKGLVSFMRRNMGLSSK